MKKTLAAAALATLSLVFSSPVKADPYKEHTTLLTALSEIGVNVIVNDKDKCFEDGEKFDGAYYHWLDLIVICQDNATIFNGKPVPFSENDLDTLRHEAHHVVQDCLDGKRDGEFLLLFKTEEERQRFYSLVGMTREIQHHITRVYFESGADYHSIMMEIEAFAVAKGINAEVLAESIKEVCDINHTNP